MFILFVVGAGISVFQAAGDDTWLALVSNGAMGVSGLYAYENKRFDLTTLTIFVMCTSVVWHSSGNYRLVDEFFSRYVAYYAFGTTALPGSVIGSFILILCVLLTYQPLNMNEMYVFVPLLVVLCGFHCRFRSLDRRFVAAVAFGIGARVCYHVPHWHSMWHVLGGISIALTVVPVVPVVPAVSAVPAVPVVYVVPAVRDERFGYYKGLVPQIKNVFSVA